MIHGDQEFMLITQKIGTSIELEINKYNDRVENVSKLGVSRGAKEASTD